jgi:3'-phosphoadenosine 5'-phosphosulfate sulfotransferase (PAPS reductase)/FAD synthetase
VPGRGLRCHRPGSGREGEGFPVGADELCLRVLRLRSEAVNDPEALIARCTAAEGNGPVIRRVCLTSGGGDSTVLAHRCRDFYDELVHLDTGTALPGVQDFVRSFAADAVGKPLRIMDAADAYRDLVLGPDEWWQLYYGHRWPDEGPDAFRDRTAKIPTRDGRMAVGVHIAPMGFPGPALHYKAYQRLKERPLEAALRDIKAEHGTGAQKQRVMLMSGVRLDESARRKMTGTARGEWERKGNQLWVNPLIGWTNTEMAAYRREHRLPVSDVMALLHKSGECMCLAFAAKGERAMTISLFPEWYEEKIRPLEEEAFRRGLKRWQWGWGAGADLPTTPIGPMCHGCEQLALAL